MRRTIIGVGVPFGVYATVLAGGIIRVGDELRLDERCAGVRNDLRTANRPNGSSSTAEEDVTMATNERSTAGADDRGNRGGRRFQLD